MNEEVKLLIEKADQAIREERFDDLLNFYSDDAVLIVKPGLEARGKAAISVVPTQGKMIMIEAGDTILVLSQTLLDADNKETSQYSMERKATYVFRNTNGKWLCVVDNSYGTSLLD